MCELHKGVHINFVKKEQKIEDPEESSSKIEKKRKNKHKYSHKRERKR